MGVAVIAVDCFQRCSVALYELSIFLILWCGVNNICCSWLYIRKCELIDVTTAEEMCIYIYFISHSNAAIQYKRNGNMMSCVSFNRLEA